MKKTGKTILVFVSALLLVYILLLIPGSPPGETIRKAGEKPFTWNKDDLWKGLEKTFREEKMADPALREARLVKLISIAETALAKTDDKLMPPEDPVFASLLYNFFAMAPVIAAGNQDKNWFISYYNRVRNSVKLQSQHWDMNSKAARNTIYQVLYGMRAAVEEVLLQSPGMTFDPAMLIKDEPSVTPSAKIFGITVHSGDLLVSRGGAVVSALISRGNDYPGNFSHVAVIYVDQKTAIPYLVEAHIERGVTVSSVAQYIADKKLRFMVMRPRADLPRLISDPMIPQKAAEYIYHEALHRHIPYDFKMNFHDPSAMFCSEAGSWAYQRYGIFLWQAISTISSPGVVRLLHEFGVENFVTMMPSDLEYDPQLAVVAEWRDPRTLLRDHIYNAVMDVMLENADKGEKIRVNPWMLPVARIVKVYSLLLNLFHKEGPIPEGMSAIQGLKTDAFMSMHSRIRSKTDEKVMLFIENHGYIPPYWQLIAMARESLTFIPTR
jgi:hypothetical protein